MTQTTESTQIDDLMLSRTEAMRRLEDARRNLAVAAGMLEAAKEPALRADVAVCRDYVESIMGELTDP
jgi:hypothetical protein